MGLSVGRRLEARWTQTRPGKPGTGSRPGQAGAMPLEDLGAIVSQAGDL